MINQILREFEDVFEEPHGLPPPREHDNGITLLPGTKSISVRPYRYPHYQKNVNEKMVHDMLKSGLPKPKPIFITCFVSSEKGWNMAILC